MFRATAVIALAAVCWAAPPLTTIQDIIYRADGSTFNGVLFIEWKSFQAADDSYIATHSLSVPVVNGVLRVQLVPTTTATPPGYYTVRYNSDGKIQFQEAWAVAQSSAPLRLKDVRISSPLGPGPIITPEPDTEIQETDVVGLVNDLAIRPVKGPGFAPSRAAVINAEGGLEAVLGSLGDCVRVDGTAGPCGSGGSGPEFVDHEAPSGAVDGVNADFGLAAIPLPASSLTLYRNGLLQRSGVDYTLSGSSVHFEPAAVPQAGDVLEASYRLADPSNPAGQAGGALSGSYPNPSLALGAVSDANVAELAGIRESKLALNFATHSSAYDPTELEKGAMLGTSGTASALNRFVTNQDSRLSDARTPAAHALLSGSHSDSSAAAPVRGDVITAQGTSPVQWKRLAIGASGRCLTSNGFDPAWGACLYTGLTAGSVPFIDASGNLAQNTTRLIWDNTNRKLSVGNNVGGATLYLYDAQSSTGATSLTVRAGQGQGTDPLQRWLNAAGSELARVDPEGRFQGASYQGGSSATRAAWRDTGTAGDPSVRSDGDVWFNSGEQTQKAAHQGQVHPVPQVICSATGSGTSATALTRLGSCTIPANLLRAGDRVEILLDLAHAGSASEVAFEVRWGGTVLVSRTAAATETMLTGRTSAGIHSGGAQWSVQSWGAALAFATGLGHAPDSLSSALTVDFLGRILTAGADVLTLRSFTVLRNPGQANP